MKKKHRGRMRISSSYMSGSMEGGHITVSMENLKGRRIFDVEVSYEDFIRMLSTHVSKEVDIEIYKRKEESKK